MVQVCDRTTSKEAMLQQSLQQYKDMYRTVEENWRTVVQVRSVLSRYLRSRHAQR